MVAGAFGQFLEELGKTLNIANLHPDSNDSCLIRMKNGIRLQLEMDSKGESLILAVDLGEVPLGRYRTDLFKEALKTNNGPLPLSGILAYSTKKNHLILFEKFSSNAIKASVVAAKIPSLLRKAAIWTESIKQGAMPPPEYQAQSPGPSQNIFGLSR